MIRQPHDRFFGRVMSDLSVAAAHLEASLPASVAAGYDWGGLVAAPTVLITRPLGERRSDLRFLAPPRAGAGPPVSLVLLLHPQSRSDRRMALRLAEEGVLGLSRWGAEQPGARWLPPFVPVVVAHGRRRWTAPTDLRGLFGVSPDPAWAGLLPSVPYVLQDLAVTPESALRGTPLGVVALRALKHAWRRDLWARLPGWEPLLAAARRQHGEEATGPLLEYLINVCPSGPDPAVSRWIADRLGEREATMVKSWAQKLHEEGREEGIALGVRRTREAQALRLLAGRFGALPPDAEARVAAADDAALERVVERIFLATSPDELLPG